MLGLVGVPEREVGGRPGVGEPPLELLRDGVVDDEAEKLGAALGALIAMAQASGADCVKLSYDADNLVARSLYASLGFRETGEREGEEIVVSLDLAGHS